MAIHSKTSKAIINTGIERRESFALNGTLRGDIVPLVDGYQGARGKGADYVVRSYNEPIAWFKDGQWFTTTRKWSRTTTNHLTNVRMAIYWATGDYGTEVEDA